MVVRHHDDSWVGSQAYSRNRLLKQLNLNHYFVGINLRTLEKTYVRGRVKFVVESWSKE